MCAAQIARPFAVETVPVRHDFRIHEQEKLGDTSAVVASLVLRGIQLDMALTCPSNQDPGRVLAGWRLTVIRRTTASVHRRRHGCCGARVTICNSDTTGDWMAREPGGSYVAHGDANPQSGRCTI